MGLFTEGLKSVLLGKHFGDSYLQSNRFKEAIFELRNSENYVIRFVTENNPREWFTVDEDIDLSLVRSACLWVFPYAEFEGVIVLSGFYASGAVDLKMEELGLEGYNFDKNKYVLELKNYLTGGDHQLKYSPFDITRAVISETKRLKALQAI